MAFHLRKIKQMVQIRPAVPIFTIYTEKNEEILISQTHQVNNKDSVLSLEADEV